MPHITICQVYSSEKVINQIEKDLRLLQNVPQPYFTGVSFIKDKKFETIWWAELSVARDPELITLQQKVVKIVTHYNLSCINDIGELYRPHLTLARINRLQHLDSLNVHNVLNPSPFMLTIGQGDHLGQFIKVERLVKE